MESGNRRNNNNNNSYGRGRGRGNNSQQQDQGRGGRGRGRGHSHPFPQQPRQQEFRGIRPGAWAPRPWGPPSPAPVQANQPPPPPEPSRPGPSVGRPVAWGPRPSGPRPTASPLPPPQPSLEEVKSQSLKISEQPQSVASSGKEENAIQPIRRPDQGGTISKRSIRLLVNHFPVRFDPQSTIIHYDVDIKPLPSDGGSRRVKKLTKSDMRLIRDKLCSDKPSQFPLFKIAYDGEKNIFSAVPLPAGKFQVEIADGEDVKGGTYVFNIKYVNELKLSKLKDYLSGNLSYIPRDILQGMDLVMKENPSRKRISAGQSFYSSEYFEDLHRGVAAYGGFRQSLKPTSQGLALCLDYSILAFRKPWPVLDFLAEHIPNFRGVDDVKRLRREVNNALKGLKVKVTHRLTKQKYVVAGLTPEDACDSSFHLVDPEGKDPPKLIKLLKYFKDKWGKDVMYPNIPCLELGKNNRSNKVPLEFCVLVEGQRYPKENLDKDAALFLKNLTLAKPWVRKNTINDMVRAEDGPCGDVTRNFGIGLDVNMTKVVGRVIGAPKLKLGASRSVEVDAEKCQWNLLGKSVVDGKSLDRWALLDFTDGDRYNKLQASAFISSLRGRCRSLGIRMEEPLLHRITRMHEFSAVNRLENLLRSVVDEASRISKGKLQMIVCVMTRRDPGYKFLKWVSETRIGVVTQCCLSSQANKGQDQYLANLCLKINVKLGGSNFELIGKLPHFEDEDHVMFIGADVNHPAPMDKSCPSIAAVVGTMNWPAANRYAARVSPQSHRTEKILNFGNMCLGLVNTYARLNKARPTRIIVFRDGVSEGQFEMVLAEELLDLKTSIYDDHYKPEITLIVAQKRHQTRLFVENRNEGGGSGNVPPGTVVDTKIVHPLDFDFYLCSHYGSLGTSKPTHYYVLWDENGFTSDELQKLIYDMCFTFARCTKPVSLVPPVYYADLVAYRGRMFQEAMIETQSPSSSSSFASSSSASSSTSFDRSFYNLHSDLENIMFFI